ncbi:MAG: hypothetical protein ACOY5B_05320 [Spirochaetota bacterium]
MRIFIVGAGAVSGGAAIAAAKKLGAEIIATTSRTENVAGADHTIYRIDLERPDAVDRMLADQTLTAKPTDFVVYIPARGAVGMDVTESTADMVMPSLEYSVIPYLKLSNALKPKRTIALSGFMALPTLTKIYGAMTFTKVAMEQLAVNNPDKLQIIRIGMFLSNSVRGIAILAQRRFTREPGFQPEWRAQWKASGKKFSQFFYDMNYEQEEQMYKQHSNGVPFRPTIPEDITNGFLMAFKGEQAPIINVLGPWLWTEQQMPELPEHIMSRTGLIPKEIYTMV